jgi:ParB family chromosome partitioning protein
LDALITSSSAITAATVAPAPEHGVVPGADTDATRRVLTVPVTQIQPSPWQPRRVFREEALDELASSIRTHGVIQPLVCRRTAPGQYELIAGERRLRAATEAGLDEVPVVLLEAEDRAAAEMTLVENLQREDLNVIEEAEGYRALADGFALTQQDIAERVGKARASVANALRLLELSDEVKQMLGAGMLSAGHAKVLLGLPDADERLRFARASAKDGWSVRVLEQKIQRSHEQPRVKAVTPDIPGDHLMLLLEKLHSRFGTNIRLAPSVRYANGRRGKGCLEIDFYGNDDLDRILGLLGIVLDDDLQP